MKRRSAATAAPLSSSACTRGGRGWGRVRSGRVRPAGAHRTQGGRSNVTSGGGGGGGGGHVPRMCGRSHLQGAHGFHGDQLGQLLGGTCREGRARGIDTSSPRGAGPTPLPTTAAAASPRPWPGGAGARSLLGLWGAMGERGAATRAATARCKRQQEQLVSNWGGQKGGAGSCDAPWLGMAAQPRSGRPAPAAGPGPPQGGTPARRQQAGTPWRRGMGELAAGLPPLPAGRADRLSQRISRA